VLLDGGASAERNHRRLGNPVLGEERLQRGLGRANLLLRIAVDEQVRAVVAHGHPPAERVASLLDQLVAPDRLDEASSAGGSPTSIISRQSSAIGGDRRTRARRPPEGAR